MKAKFLCLEVTKFTGSKKAKLVPVYSQVGENADFAKATPSGELSITIDGGTQASDFFEPGEYYYLDFTRISELPVSNNVESKQEGVLKL